VGSPEAGAQEVEVTSSPYPATEAPSRTQRYPHPVCCYRTAWGTWFVQIQRRGEKHYLGTAASVEEAVELRDAFLEGMDRELLDASVVQ
jgi:hypothetical protein